jgi:hypothetical protein
MAEVMPWWAVWFSATPARMERYPTRTCWREVGRLYVDPTGPVHALHCAADRINDRGGTSLGIEAGGHQVVIAQSDRGIEKKIRHRDILT